MVSGGSLVALLSSSSVKRARHDELKCSVVAEVQDQCQTHSRDICLWSRLLGARDMFP